MVTFPSFASGTNIVPNHSFSVSVSGDDRLLIVATASIETTFFAPSIFGHVYGVTVNGVGPTLLLEDHLGGMFGTGDSYDMYIRVWGQLAPTLGTAIIEMDTDDGSIGYGAIVLNDVLQSDPYGSIDASSGSGTTVVAPVTLAPCEALVQAYVSEWNGFPTNPIGPSVAFQTLDGITGRAGDAIAFVQSAGANWTLPDAVAWQLQQLIIHTSSDSCGGAPGSGTRQRSWVQWVGVGA